MNEFSVVFREKNGEKMNCLNYILFIFLKLRKPMWTIECQYKLSLSCMHGIRLKYCKNDIKLHTNKHTKADLAVRRS